MHYFIAIQMLCGFFASHVAGRKGHSAIVWWIIGALVPVLGVALALLIGARGATHAGGAGAQARRAERSRPRRCCGSFIPDCLGCAYFRRILFADDGGEHPKGRCTLLSKDLHDGPKGSGPDVMIED